MPALVANATATGGNTTSGINTTGASLLALVIASYSTAVPTISDSKSNSWSAHGTQRGAGGESVITYYVVNPTVGSAHTFTADMTGCFVGFLAMAFSGITTTSPFDQENGTANSTSPGSVTPGVSGELLIAGICYDPANTLSVNSSFTLVTGTDYGAGVNMGVGAAYKVSSSAENPVWSGNNGFTNQTTNILTFKPSAASGFARPYPFLQHIARQA